jgi:hypothetical protein
MHETLLAAALLILAGPSAAENITPVATVMRDKKTFDHQWLCLQGKAAQVDPQVSPVKHHQYWTAKLQDDMASIILFAYGLPPFKNGETIEACGIFARLKKAQSTGEVFHDEFNVTNVLKGPSIGAGKVKITPTGIVAVAGDGKETAAKYANPAQPLSH